MRLESTRLSRPEIGSRLVIIKAIMCKKRVENKEVNKEVRMNLSKEVEEQQNLQ